MQAIAFYLAYPLLFLIALLPFPLLYLFSDGLFYLFWLTGYRKKVVRQNLQNSFPDKTPAEVEQLVKAYYRYLCDLILETLKTLTMTEREARKRCLFEQSPYLDQLYKDKKSFIMMLGHLGNWEWAGPGFSLNSPYQLVVIYRPLSNPYFDKMMSGMRTKFRTRIASAQNTLREMVANRSKGEITATAFIADQTAPRDHAYWTNFLHQDTAVYTGAEKLAIKFDYPVVYISVKRIKRGYYQIATEPLVHAPRETKEGEITELFTRRLEKDILEEPTTWLWSHKRWKHKREMPVVKE